jgi:hypothetical protein
MFWSRGTSLLRQFYKGVHLAGTLAWCMPVSVMSAHSDESPRCTNIVSYMKDFRLAGTLAWGKPRR